jgi:hypothetical protein
MRDIDDDLHQPESALAGDAAGGSGQIRQRVGGVKTAVGQPEQVVSEPHVEPPPCNIVWFL